ncbi:MAG: hypothetical protein ACOX3A_01190 [bacterium]|jgi:hypothetical protein
MINLRFLHEKNLASYTITVAAERGIWDEKNYLYSFFISYTCCPWLVSTAENMEAAGTFIW